MNTTGTNGLFGAVDDGSAAIPGYQFNFLGNNYNGNIFIGSNGYMTFGGGSNVYSGLSASNPPYPAIMFSSMDRLTNWVNYDTFFTNSNGTQIGRILYNTADYGNGGVNLQIEILLIRNTSTLYQYIQFNCLANNAGIGVWYIKTASSGVGVANFNINNFTPGQSFVFRCDASGNNWEFLNQSRIIYSPI